MICAYNVFESGVEALAERSAPVRAFLQSQGGRLGYLYLQRGDVVFTA
jgi:hypothetical protein